MPGLSASRVKHRTQALKLRPGLGGKQRASWARGSDLTRPTSDLVKAVALVSNTLGS